MIRKMESRNYQILYVDPPYSYTDCGNLGLARYHYDVWSRKDLLEWPKPAMVSDPAGCMLFLWVPGPQMEFAQRLITAWGFKYKTVFLVWAKTHQNNKFVFGLGHYTRPCCEFLLLAVRGKPKLSDFRTDAKNVSQLLISMRRQHSRKPDAARRIIDTCFKPELRRIELFARETVPGWDCWGNETTKFNHASEVPTTQ